jgi:phage repressor protein C with HTH and peptisase S24 domain/DNA-binding XRE family transcriptional regulator
MNESLAQRIKRLRKAAGLSQAELAEACGWKSQSRVGNYEAGTREPTLADLAAIASAVGVPESEIILNTSLAAPVIAQSVATGAVDMVREMLAQSGKSLPIHVKQKLLAAAEANSEQSSNVVSADFSGLRVKPDEVLIPQYDIRAAMGHGQVPPDYNETMRNLIVREDVLREKGVTYTALNALAVITGWGQSMEGTINDKDPVIVDRGVTEFVGDGIYVVTWHGLLYIKRLQMADEDHFWLISDNEKHKDQQARIDDVTIHAKVLLIWNARKA